MNAAPPIARYRAQPPDAVFSSLALALLLAGVLMSASARVYSEAVHGGVPRGLFTSGLHLAIGLFFLVLTVVVDYHRLARPGAIWAMLAGISLLLFAALLGPEIKDTHRWIVLGGQRFQPSELAKPALVLALAAALLRTGPEIRTLQGLARPIGIAGWLGALVLAGKDLGTPALLFGTMLVLVVACGARWRHVAALLGGGAVLFWIFARAEPYRVARLTDFTSAVIFDPHRLGAIPHQLRQSIIAIGSGGLLGRGFGASTQKAFFLPEPDNDFIFAVICEELGLWGGVAVVVAFLLLAWRGWMTAERAPDDLGRLVALGATVLLAVQALCHMGVVTGLLPTKGLPLPFLSTGGSSLVASCILVGLVLNVSVRSRRDDD
ncbi:MAG: FtsW/RodA/SpoVE family cell cycle protein [Acidobacteria bacterium]|nr:FtsW/RodA/SpoVE family cell cycle protein [Acidobacteriota bacterium]MCU0254009.1 FtsW/RodA/SpoVE family cell cycle protein [Acidobacteriota bacterium]